MDMRGPGAALPGGMSVRQAMRRVSPGVAFSRGVVYAALAALAAVAVSEGDVVFLVGLGVFAVLVAFLARVTSVQAPGVRVTERAQPEMWTAVARVAASLDVAPPHRVSLTHRPEVTVRAGRHRYAVMIGLPVLAVLEEHEIRGLLAHQLAPLALPRPDLVLPLADEWRAVAAAQSDDDASRDDRRTELALRDAALAVERAADAAAVAAAGSREAAVRALAVISEFDLALLEFRHSLDLPPRSPRSLARPALEDIDDVWRRAARAGWSPWGWDEEDAVDSPRCTPTSPTRSWR